MHNFFQVKVTDLQENIKNVNLPDFLKKYVLKDETAITQKVLKQVLGVDVTRYTYHSISGFYYNNYNGFRLKEGTLKV